MIESLEDFLYSEIDSGRLVPECPPVSCVKFIFKDNEFMSTAVTVTHAGLKREGMPFAWHAASPKIALEEFTRNLSALVRGRAWGFRRSPMVSEEDGKFVCTARVFIFDPAVSGMGVGIVPDER